MWKYHTHYPLLSHNTFGMDVEAAAFVEYDEVPSLVDFLQSPTFAAHRTRFIHIGAGSNLLFAHDYDGLVMHSAIRDLSVVHEDDAHILLRVGAGYVWDHFVQYCVQHGYAGVENLTAIPGEVGASAVQNIGAYGVEVCDVIHEVHTVDLDGHPRIFRRDECGYGYRQSIFKEALRGQYIVTHVVYRLSKQPDFKLNYGDLHQRVLEKGQPTLGAVRESVAAIRAAKLPDPEVLGNAGSFFKNPIIPLAQYQQLLQQYPDMPSYVIDAGHRKVPAGWLIEQTGWKGRSLGRAAVHQRQALVLVNLGGATGEEIMALAQRICHDVQEKFGISISPEVNYV